MVKRFPTAFENIKGNPAQRKNSKKVRKEV